MSWLAQIGPSAGHQRWQWWSQQWLQGWSMVTTVIRRTTTTMTPITTTRMMMMIITMLQDEGPADQYVGRCQVPSIIVIITSWLSLGSIKWKCDNMWTTLRAFSIEIHQIWPHPISHSFPPAWLVGVEWQAGAGEGKIYNTAAGTGGLCHSLESGLAKCCWWRYETSS